MSQQEDNTLQHAIRNLQQSNRRAVPPFPLTVEEDPEEYGRRLADEGFDRYLEERKQRKPTEDTNSTE